MIGEHFWREPPQENESRTVIVFFFVKGMYVGLKQPLGDGERCVTPARAAAKETTVTAVLLRLYRAENTYLPCLRLTAKIHA